MDNYRNLLKIAVTAVDKELDRTLYFTESNYQNALIHLLNRKLPEVSVNREVHINYKLKDGYVFGSGRADIVLESSTHVIILELKVSVDCKYIRKFIGQTLRYIRNYPTTKKVQGVLIIFNSSHGGEPFIKWVK